jgi:hypothetical protein
MSRQIWMFPRNKRRMPPLETALILRAMVVASELGNIWGGEQKKQNKFSQILEEYGLKKGGNQRDENSGGPRTYESQMSLLGLLFKDKDGKLNLTQAGEDLVAFNNTAKTFEYQVLKAQFPSAYSMSKGVGLNQNIKIRPFIFLLKLANDEELNGLADKDMVVPVVFGKDANCFEICKTLIQKLRIDGVESVIPDDETIRTSKTVNNSYERRLSDIHDIANTFKNILESSGLAGLRVVDGQTRVFPRHDIIEKISEIDALPFVDFVNLPKEQATLQYGKRFGANRDTRRTFMPTKAPELLSSSGLIYRRFLDEVSLPVSQAEIDEFAKTMSDEFKINREQVINALEPILVNTDQYTGSKLLDVSRGGVITAMAFEKSVEKIFKLDFGFETEWTGRTHRKKTGGYMDVFVVETGRNLCGIIDTKSMKSYDLPTQDMGKVITNYIDAASELFGSRNLELKFVAYISHLIGSGAATRAKEIYDLKKVPVSLISAYGLNSMRENYIYKNNSSLVTNVLSKEPVNLIL